MLLKHSALVNMKDKDGFTPLYSGITLSFYKNFLKACTKGHKEIAEILLLNNAEINTNDKNGWLALYAGNHIL